ncbi:unnamed protein product [Ixodes hexagonus]
MPEVSQALLSARQQPERKSPSQDSEADYGGHRPEKIHKNALPDLWLRLSFLKRKLGDSSARASVRPSSAEAKQWALSFPDLAASKYGLALFHVFLSREFSEENLEFWLACEEFKKCRCNKLPVKAKRIFNEFIAPRAPKEVNLDALTRSQVMDSLARPDRQCLDRAQRRVQALMEQDAYLRFLQCDLYLDLCGDQEEPQERHDQSP